MKMAKNPRRIKVASGTELANALEEADREGTAVVLDKDGLLYRVVPESEEEIAPEDLWRNYDPQKALEAWQSVRGLWKGMDVDKFVEETYASRHLLSKRPDVEL